jgi:hypothetical protein
MTDGDIQKKDESEWWLSHIGEMADHYRNVYQRHELRARYVLVMIGFVIAGVRILFNDFNTSKWSIDSAFIYIWLGSVLIAAILLVCVMVPLNGSRFFKGSFEDKIYISLQYLRWDALKNLESYPLSDQFKNAAKSEGPGSLEAKKCLARYLNGEFVTDLESWVMDQDEKAYDIKRRQIFWYWANKESSQRKAIMLEVAIGTILWSSTLSITGWFVMKIISALLHL